MGGKVKQAQRTKNNSRPSNSSRSAELLGTTVSSFVGFTAHSDLGFVPLAPGFANDSLPETFDASVGTQFQLVFRKMSKKDPITKTKALQEFVELINNSDIEIVKTILPLWPKFYCNLAVDVEHRVRETAQQAQSAIVDKAGKSVAPYLKQIAPVWIASQFDDYAPASSLASTTFRTIFAPHKVQEVFGFCQSEILEYISKNVLFHTASTLNSAKLYTPEEAENKYCRLVMISLKTFSLYLEKVNTDKIKEVEDKIENILQNQKFWSFAKHKDQKIKSAWFELLYTFLHNNPQFLETRKQQVIQIIFQNIDNTDPITVSHIWGCVLLVQQTYSNWYSFINFKKVIQPKLFSLIKSNYRGCANIFCPNLLPFISKFSNESLQNTSINSFYMDLLNCIKQSLMGLNQTDNKSDVVAFVTAFFECVRYVFKKESTAESYDLEFCEKILVSFVLEVIEWCIGNPTVTAKSIFSQVSSLMAYLAEQLQTSDLYLKLLEKFWLELEQIGIRCYEKNENDSGELCRCLEFIQCLYTCNPNHSTNNKVKFSCVDLDDEKQDVTVQSLSQESKETVLNKLKELRQIAEQLGCKFIEKISKEKKTQFATQLNILIKMFGNEKFYLKITNTNDLQSAFNVVSSLLASDYPCSESVIDVVFEVLLSLDENKQVENIDKLLKTSNSIVQQWIIHRLLSYPLCIRPEIRKILSQDHVSEIILNFARDFIKENSKEKLNLLHKCFFQNNTEEFLINEKTIKGIVQIMSEPMQDAHNNEMNDVLDTCCSFIAQTMTTICYNNVSKELQKEIFLKIFKFSIETTAENENLTEDTLWEVVSCWQDALCSGDIEIDDELKTECSKIIEKKIMQSNEDDEQISIQDITNVADLAAKLVTCSSNSKSDEQFLDSLIRSLLNDKNSKHQEIFINLNTLCLHFELINGKITNIHPEEYELKNISLFEIRNLFRRQLCNFEIISKLIGKIIPKEDKDLKKLEVMDAELESNNSAANNDDGDEEEENDFDVNDDSEVLKIWSSAVYEYFILALKTLSLGRSLIINSNLINKENENLIKNLEEKICSALEYSPQEFLCSLKEKIFFDLNSKDISSIRILNFLNVLNQYCNNENGSILLLEDSSMNSLDKQNFGTSLNIIEILLNKLPSRSIPINYEILNEQTDIAIRIGYLRSLLLNYFSGDHNEMSDKNILSHCLKLITEIETRKNSDKTLLLFEVDISKQDIKSVFLVIEFINLLSEILDNFPNELEMKHWDVIRISLSSWVLSVSKSITQWRDPKAAIFIASVYKLFKTLSKFLITEKTKSSTQELTTVIEEWENIFATEVNLILFKSFIGLVVFEKDLDRYRISQTALVDSIASAIEYLNYATIFKASQSTFKYKTDEIIEFCMENFSNEIHNVRITSLFIIQKLIPFLISIDVENLEKRNNMNEKINKESNNDDTDKWHLLHKFIPFLQKYETKVEKYLSDFDYKLTDLPNFQPINRDDALSYFYLWDCVIFIFSKSTAELRSLYASTIRKNKFEQILLNFLFRCMPIEVLKNHDSKIMNNEIFKTMSWDQLKDYNVSIEKFACHTYTQMLKHLPAVVRKWWNSTNSRQKTFIDKLTTNFVSNLICNEELRAIAKHEKHENMQVTVHTSTREVIAVYSIDEAKMELIITLAPNHPLGAVKVESLKQIGSRAQSRSFGLHLTIFLTHQNGSIFDGLSIWKKDLDKKFEGVEECFVCYTVIHQDTCQLPKLTCKTCKKKFHGPCLYKWFTTSSKSTCPLCRNVF